MRSQFSIFQCLGYKVWSGEGLLISNRSIWKRGSLVNVFASSSAAS